MCFKEFINSKRLYIYKTVKQKIKKISSVFVFNEDLLLKQKKKK